MEQYLTIYKAANTVQTNEFHSHSIKQKNIDSGNMCDHVAVVMENSVIGKWAT